VTIIAKSPATGSLPIDAMAGPGSGLEFQVPEKQLNFAGPVALAVTSAVEPPGEPPLSDLAAKRCRDLQRSDLFVCIDELFTSDGGSCGTDVDPVFAAITALPTQNDFKKMCVKDNGEDPRCNGAAEPSYAITYTLDTSGNVLLSMHWGNILRQKPGSNQEKDRRWVEGSVLEAFLSSGSPIEIPGAAFLESFNPVGVSFSPKPIFLPGVLPEPSATSGQATASGQTPTPGQPATPTPKEVAFYGTADKDTSVLRIARRKLWNYACSVPLNAGQACDPEQPSDCPAGTCVSQPSASYFACDQGLRDKLPCTRPQHCPKGQCLRVTQLHCFNLSGGQTTKPCTTDSNCGPGEECGLWLFNLSSKLRNGIGTFPRDKYHARAHHYASSITTRP
jgi:hypothetical protein